MTPGEIKSISTELRVRVSQYGYSDMDRQRLRITIEDGVAAPVAYEEVEEVEGAEVLETEAEVDSTVKLSDYRQRLSGDS